MRVFKPNKLSFQLLLLICFANFSTLENSVPRALKLIIIIIIIRIRIIIRLGLGTTTISMTIFSVDLGKTVVPSQH